MHLPPSGIVLRSGIFLWTIAAAPSSPNLAWIPAVNLIGLRYMGMSRHTVRTTVRVESVLADRVRREARARNTTVTALLEEALQLVMHRSDTLMTRPPVVLPVGKELGGTLPGIDLNNSSGLLDAM